jgi:putative protease
MKKIKLPELLSPAGSPDAFRAAIDGGADAIYMGGASFNARIGAKNFTGEDISEAVKLAHAYGVKVYQTVNIQIFDRELDDFLSAAEHSARLGMDAFIVSDLGAASVLRERFPEIELHASTQMSVHNVSGANYLYERGFSRVVPARELCRADIEKMACECGAEIEIFIHGALCVSHSGQCLFSSLVGGRSGNRGLCAQPCRLPYAAEGQRVCDKYPLSLKDMSLASHVREIIDSGVASLKIEGRMKSPEYVRGVTRVWRRLLDEGRDATELDMRELADIFSRGGFTDAYYTKNVSGKMLGVRSEQDKQASREVDKFTKIERRVPLDMKIRLCAGEPSELVASCRGKSVTVMGDAPEAAINAPLDEQSVTRCLAKLGSTCFYLDKCDIELGGHVMMPISALNALRRAAVDALTDKLTATKEIKVAEVAKKHAVGVQKRANTARFLSSEQITDAARAYFDTIFLPLSEYVKNGAQADGFYMPPVIFDSEMDGIEALLRRATEKNPTVVIVSNLGHIQMVKSIIPDAKMIADFRFNIANDRSVAFFEEQGFESVIGSAEMSLAQLRDLGGARGAVVYGRIPLMTLEKCAIKALYGKDACDICSRGQAKMVDRRGVSFPIIRELPHRNIVLNSLPTCMADKQDELDRANILDRHFIFTVESADEVDRVVECFKKKLPLPEKVRRI